MSVDTAREALQSAIAANPTVTYEEWLRAWALTRQDGTLKQQESPDGS